MIPGAGGDFAASFLEDYFAESEEHLAVLREALLALEEPGDDPDRESSLLETLFRSFHSLKGLSAMVDVREAEHVAHELESYLRALRRAELPVTTQAVTLLIAGTAALESVIASKRSGQPPPPVESVLAQVTEALETAAVNRRDRPARDTAMALPDPRAGAWRFTFVPSPSLVERGIKVDTVRSRLASVGRILSVSPKVSQSGGIAFEFLVAGPADDAAFQEWSADGLTWERAPADAEADPDAQTPAHGGVASPDGQPPEHSVLAPSHFVRVDLKKLDDVMGRVAVLVVTRARFEESLQRIERLLPASEWRTLQENSLALERQLRDLREDVMRVRLVRIDEIFRRMPFAARDLARETGKDVKVVLRGQETEIDKFLVERMMDPVLHLVRNAVSHGIESPAERAAAGKPPQAVVTLRASTSGQMVLLEIADDGRGIAMDAVAERARAAGLLVPDGPLDAQSLLDLICEPGFSTREHTDRVSGRGIGMAVVRNTIRELGGTLDIETEAGHGTRFLVALPLTLAITGALIASAGGQTFAVPQSTVQEVIEVDCAAVRRMQSNELLPYRGRALPLLRLSRLFGLGENGNAKLHAFVVGAGQDAVGVAVDRIVAQREIVVRTITDPLLKIDGVTGATELGDGRVVLILDLPALSRAGRTSSARTARVAAG
jgi:two-component system, chemotaxis family, sensor kinase CheA